ncbi:MAG TPA: DUF1254 domain-containing protein [Bosea sp. (in: a-proteobacteria)]|nr:DUF1254 domain-containing protein [Bosea sp. (in: a-proteobacteria)]
MSKSRRVAFGVVLAVAAGPALAQSVPVTVDSFTRAETDRYFAANAKEAGGLGKFHHAREPASIDNQTVIRLNRDTLYSFAVFDLAAGPATVTLPDAGKRFMSMMIADQDHYVPFVAYDTKPRTLTQKGIGTRYAFVAIRTLVDPSDPKDLAAVHKLQDSIKVSQKEPGKLDLPNWDQASLKEVRDALLALAKHSTSFAGSFGARGKVDPVHHLIGTAAGWGGNPDKDASYTSFTPPKNDGKTVYKLNVPKNVPVAAFWSVSVYNAKGFFEKNASDAYSVNDITAKKNADGSVTIQFGGCDGKIPNCLPIVEGWNYTARMYRPGPQILSGKWKFPEPQPVN